MSTKPLRSHIIPRSYLAGFTPSGTKGDKLWVFEDGKEHPRAQSPGEVGWLPDFYRVDVPGADPTLLENALGEVENRAMRELRKFVNPSVGQTLSLEGLGHLLTFVALLWTRTPRSRQAIAEGHRKKVTTAIASNLVSREQYERVIEAARRANVMAPIVDYDQMKLLAAKDQIDLSFPWNVLSDRSLHLAYLEDMMGEVFMLLVQRRWTLFLAAEGHFICSDDPIVLLPADTSIGPHGNPRAFADPKSIVLVPLHRDLAWIGSYDGASKVALADREWVADFNSVITVNAERYVFSSEPDYLITGPDGVPESTRRLKGWFRIGQSYLTV